jgi:hypothetical protein
MWVLVTSISRQADTWEKKCDNCYMMRSRSCSRNSSSSSDDALYSYMLLVYTHIHWTFISSLLVRSFACFALSFYKNKKKLRRKGERERKSVRVCEREKNTTRGEKREREQENWLWYWLLIIVDEKRWIKQLYFTDIADAT